MSHVGIDLGTTNSAICSYDGETTRLYKSPEQHDVTPSAIFIDRRGNRYVGSRAYGNAARNPDNAATLFKRLMGTSTPIKLAAAGLVMTPEDCSAEILKTLFGYLPEDIRHHTQTGTVITVPAAFNQMQKAATMAAAEAAKIGQVALMQEPVAAVMSVMRTRKSDGVFLVYDLGGGTLDVAIAEGIGGRVSVLAHDGIEMCGGRDFDRLLFEEVVEPWLRNNFQLPENLDDEPRFKTLRTMALWAVEKAKIDLSQREEAIVSLPENELGVRDLSGNEVFIDVAVDRRRFDRLISEKLSDSIARAQETLKRARLAPQDVERIVFVGGPTHYRPLRDRVASELGIAGSTDVNPMTAVAEGAALFAESIDWSTQSRGRKSARGSISSGGKLDVTLNYVSRTPELKARIIAKVGRPLEAGYELQIDSLDTGWSSGRIALSDGVSIDVTLMKPGENAFKVFVFDARGGPVALGVDKIVISRTASSVDAIPASHSVGIEARERIGGGLGLDYLVREGEALPKKGRRVYPHAAESMRAGTDATLNFKLWEGEAVDPLTDNRCIGLFAVRGSHLSEGLVVPEGAELIVDFEMLDSGQLRLDVTIPAIGSSFKSGQNFYSRQEGQIDYSKASQLIKEQSLRVADRLEAIAESVDDPRLDQARDRLAQAATIQHGEGSPEDAKQAHDHVQEAKRLLAQTRADHLREIRQVELDGVSSLFDSHVRQYARHSEASAFDNLVKTAGRVVGNRGGEFESHIDELRGKVAAILWRQDWFVIDRFNSFAASSHGFPDTVRHATLVAAGVAALNANDVDTLRRIVGELNSSRVGSTDHDDLLAIANIVKGA